MAFIGGLGFGGSTTFLCNLTGELVRRGVPVIVISPEAENAFASDFQAAGVKVVLHDDKRLIFEDRMRAMLHNLAEFRPTVVVGCVGADSYEVLRYVPAGIRRIALIQTDHPMLYEAALPYAGQLDEIAGISTKITERLMTMEAFSAATKRCLLHGVAMPATFTPRRQDSRPLRILYLGRIMDPQKRVGLFPKILADLKRSGIPFCWTIVGKGEERPTLEKLMTVEDPNQQVIFSDPMPNVSVPELLKSTDVFLLASDSEGLPISLLEAMAHGVVPVVSDLESGIRDVVDTRNGMLVPVDQVDGYAKAIIHLHEHREELAVKSIAAQARVQTEFSTAAMADRWMAAFPPSAQPIIEWPREIDVQAPLAHMGKFIFSKYMRFFRRMKKARF